MRNIFFLLLLLWASVVRAQESSAVPSFTSEPWNAHFQITWTPMYHGTFWELYPGNPGGGSLEDYPEFNSSTTSTIFLGLHTWTDGAIYVDAESSAGTGFSNVTGIAGFPNGEMYRVSDPGVKVVMNRVYLKQVFGLGGDQETIKDDQNQLAEKVDVSRITLVVGKFSLTDFFDQNAYSADPRNQFLNWSLWADGAWDYPADLQGYTWGFVLEYNQPRWALRISSVLENAVPNSSDMDLNLAQAHGDTAEFEYRYDLQSHPGKLRCLLFMNHADMGTYSAALAQVAGTGDAPNVDNTHQYGTKWGCGLDWEQELGQDLGFFFRLGWQDGNEESWTFTAIDQTAQAGLLFSGYRWGRPGDQWGVAGAINGLAASHQQYLAAGGQDFLIGDGQLNYGPEIIFETFYDFHITTEASLSPDFQWITNPGYNQDRGPVGVIGFRCHLEI